MNDQRLLFPLRSHETEQSCRNEAGCHRRDPETSREAAEHLRRSGRLGAQQRAVLEALRQCDGATHAELGALMGVHWLTPARRLPELGRAGLVRKGKARTCSVKGSKCCTWWLADGGER